MFKYTQEIEGWPTIRIYQHETGNYLHTVELAVSHGGYILDVLRQSHVSVILIKKRFILVLSFPNCIITLINQRYSHLEHPMFALQRRL